MPSFFFPNGYWILTLNGMCFTFTVSPICRANHAFTSVRARKGGFGWGGTCNASRWRESAPPPWASPYTLTIRSNRPTTAFVETGV